VNHCLAKLLLLSLLLLLLLHRHVSVFTSPNPLQVTHPHCVGIGRQTKRFLRNLNNNNCAGQKPNVPKSDGAGTYFPIANVANLILDSSPQSCRKNSLHSLLGTSRQITPPAIHTTFETRNKPDWVHR
jgi:hypothetical protein